MIGATRLPLHPRPLPHEALSSWVDRLAHAYGMERERFLRLAFGVDPAPDAGELDVDGALPGLEAALAARTGVPPQRVREMTLAGYAPRLTGATEPSPGLFDDYAGRFAWFVQPLRRASDIHPAPVGSWLPWRASDLLDDLPRCCPRCLVADAIPYARLHWRLAWMASCPLHGELLVPLAFIRDVWDRKPQRAAPDLVALDRITLGAVTTGTAVLPRRGGPVPGGAWLRALRTLLHEVGRPVAWFDGQGREEVSAAWLRAVGRSLGGRHGWHRATFEGLLPEQRSVLLRVAGAAVRCQAALPSWRGPGMMLRAYVTQWSADQVCGALPA